MDFESYFVTNFVFFFISQINKKPKKRALKKNPKNKKELAFLLINVTHVKKKEKTH